MSSGPRTPVRDVAGAVVGRVPSGTGATPGLARRHLLRRREAFERQVRGLRSWSGANFSHGTMGRKSGPMLLRRRASSSPGLRRTSTGRELRYALGLVMWRGYHTPNRKPPRLLYPRRYAFGRARGGPCPPLHRCARTSVQCSRVRHCTYVQRPVHRCACTRVHRRRGCTRVHRCSVQRRVQVQNFESLARPLHLNGWQWT